MRGFEPPSLAALGPKPSVSANSTTSPFGTSPRIRTGIHEILNLTALPISAERHCLAPPERVELSLRGSKPQVRVRRWGHFKIGAGKESRTPVFSLEG